MVLDKLINPKYPKCFLQTNCVSLTCYESKVMNKKVILDKRPIGLPSEEVWRYETSEIPTPEEGQFVVKHEYVSLDPAMRGWMNDVPSYIPPVALGDVMRAGTIGKVVASKNDKFPVGAIVSGGGGVQQYSLGDGKNEFLVPANDALMPKFLGAMGMPGMTAYFGILDVGKIKEGDRVLVSGAAGAVGSVVGQIAKIIGCEVVGIAGGPDKCKHVVDTLGFDDCVDYKSPDFKSALRASLPKGIDVYFDNVGGETLDMALAKLRKGARVVLCGAISQYNTTGQIQGPKNYLSLLINRASMQGLIVFDYKDRYGEAVMQIGQWVAEGKLKTDEDIYEGIENFHSTFLRLFNGNKRGKLILKVN